MGRPCGCCGVLFAEHLPGSIALQQLWGPAMGTFATSSGGKLPSQITKRDRAYFVNILFTSPFPFSVANAAILTPWLEDGGRLCVVMDYRHRLDPETGEIVQTLFPDVVFDDCNEFLTALGASIQISPRDVFTAPAPTTAVATFTGSTGLVAGLGATYAAAWSITSGGSQILEAGGDNLGAIEGVGDGLLMVISDFNVLAGGFSPPVDYADAAECWRRFCREPVPSLL